MEHNINVCTATQVGCTTAEKGEFDGSLEQMVTTWQGGDRSI